MRDNAIDIAHLQKADITNGDLQDIVVVLDTLSSMFVLPRQATDALDRLRKLVDGKTP
jgi:hypothetical protein